MHTFWEGGGQGGEAAGCPGVAGEEEEGCALCWHKRLPSNEGEAQLGLSKGGENKPQVLSTLQSSLARQQGLQYHSWKELSLCPTHTETHTGTRKQSTA